MCQLVTINFDKSVCVKYIAVYLNTFLLQFDFYQLGTALDVSLNSYVFTIYDPVTDTELLKIVNVSWSRPVINEIKYNIPSLNIAPGTYKIDLTCTYPSGLIQTLASGDIEIKPRNIA